MRTFLQAKIHRAVITDANLDYEGSISICPDLITAAGLFLFERVDIYNLANGERFSTYVIPGKQREIALNGAAAHKGRLGDLVIIAAYVDLDEKEIESHAPVAVHVDSENRITSVDVHNIAPIPLS